MARPGMRGEERTRWGLSSYRLEKLQRDWRRANLAEKRMFRSWIAHEKPRSRNDRQDRKRSAPIVDSEGRLLPNATMRIRRVMTARNMKLGSVMKELGFNTLNASLGLAMRWGFRLHDPTLIKALELWLERHRSR
jgi:hypothetical protein